MYPRRAWLHPQRKAKIAKGTKGIRRQEWEVWFVRLINDYLGGKEKGSLGTLGQTSRLVTHSRSLLHTSQYPTKMSLTHQFWANFPSWVVWPTGGGGGKNKTKDKIKWAHWHFILSCMEDGLVLTGIQRNLGGPRLLLWISFFLGLAGSPTFVLVLLPLLTSVEVFTNHRPCFC